MIRKMLSILCVLVLCGAALAEAFKPESAAFLPPKDLTAIEDYAFEGIAAASVYLPDGLKAIGHRAFGGNHNLSKIYIPSSVTDIAPDAFEDCSSNMTIYGYKNTAAHTFAQAHGYRFTAQDGGNTLPSIPIV